MGSASVSKSLNDLGTAPRVKRNLSTQQLVEAALASGDTIQAANGALVALTGARTGRSPRDNCLVEDDRTRTRADWGKVNQPFSAKKFDALLERVIDHLRQRELFVLDLFSGADPAYQLPIRVISEYAWHALFFLFNDTATTESELAAHVPEFTVISAPEFDAEPERD